MIFPGKYLDRDLTTRKEIMYEYQYNTLFSYAEGERLDAVLIMADSNRLLCHSGADQGYGRPVQQYPVCAGRVEDRWVSQRQL